MVVDYGRGNLFSLKQALTHVGVRSEISNDPDRMLKADRIVLPGVGAFGDGITAFNRLGLAEPIREAAAKGTPILGICLGMQLFATRSTEFGEHDGLDLIPGIVVRLPDDARTRIPNIGWRPLHIGKDDGFLDGLPENRMVYFLHSYWFDTAEPEDTTAYIDFNGARVAAIVRHDNLVGYQFHPEKSSELGLELIRRFIEDFRP